MLGGKAMAYMHNYYMQGYTLADIVGLAREKTVTHTECAEILEDAGKSRRR